MSRLVGSLIRRQASPPRHLRADVPADTPNIVEANDLNFVGSPAVRRAIVAELRDNGMQRWTHVYGRQIPASVVARHMGCGEQALGAFVRLVRENGGCVTVDIPPGWINFVHKLNHVIKNP